MLAFVTLVCLTAACLGKSTSLSLAEELSDGRIVGGETVNIEDYPYQVALQMRGAHHCGASIISANWAVTAAHCVRSELNRMTIRSGSSYRGTGGSVHKVAEVISHTLYNSATSDYDIALLKVETPFEFGPGVAEVKLPSADECVATGTQANVTGWGALKEGGSLPPQLQVVHVPVMSQAECQRVYLPMLITSRMICAGYDEGGKDSCQGDSGGPMVSEGQLIGVVSWGRGCARPSYPGVYTRVASVRSWITQNSGV